MLLVNHGDFEAEDRDDLVKKIAAWAIDHEQDGKPRIIEIKNVVVMQGGDELMKWPQVEINLLNNEIACMIQEEWTEMGYNEEHEKEVRDRWNR